MVLFYLVMSHHRFVILYKIILHQVDQNTRVGPTLNQSHHVRRNGRWLNQQQEGVSCFSQSSLSHQSNKNKVAASEVSSLPLAMFVPILVAFAAGLLGWKTYHTLTPPPPKICGSPNGPPVTSPRVKLSDGRHLAYREMGVPKDEAMYKVIVVHGFDASKDLNLPIPKEIVEEMRIYFLFFDRAGYGESDPYPSRSVKSEAYDIQELADKLQIGSKFYVIGFSMGGYPVYGCLKYIPHRLAGVALVVPFVHYWWPRVPADISKTCLRKLPASDQRTFHVAYYAPWLFYWWMTQKWFPSLSMMAGNMAVFSPPDMKILSNSAGTPSVGQEKIRQQGLHESLYRDIIAGYAKWEFDPLDLTDPFPGNEGSVHIWQGKEDRIVPKEMNRYLSEKLPWIRYHEVADAGHLMFSRADICQQIFRELLLG